MNFIKNFLVINDVRNEKMKRGHQLLVISILSINILACSSDNDEPVSSLILPTKVNVASGNSTQAVPANNAALLAAM